MRPSPAPSPAPSTHDAAPAVERAVDLDLDADAAVQAVTSAERLSDWLGRWSETDEGATVVTDDGVVRAVRDLVRGPRGTTWTWAPAHGGPSSTVTIEVTPLEDGRSRVTVRETVTGAALDGAHADDGTAGTAGIALDGLGWAVCLLALEIAAAARSLATAGVG
jgi:hypothetical protein